MDLWSGFCKSNGIYYSMMLLIFLFLYLIDFVIYIFVLKCGDIVVVVDVRSGKKFIFVEFEEIVCVVVVGLW